MSEIVILIAENKDGVLDGLRMKKSLQDMGLEIIGVLTRSTDGKRVPKELIEKMLNAKIMGSVKDIEDLKEELKKED